MLTATPAGIAIFDFDWTLIDTDSDRFVIQYLSPEIRKKLDNKSIQWTDLQNLCLEEYYGQGGSGHTIREALTKIPMDPAMIEVCKLLHSKGWSLVIISDSNTVYIESILEHIGIRNLFSAIITNPAHWDDQDRLRIKRLIPADGPPHGCTVGVCSLNLCKGKQVEQLLLQYQQGSEAASTPMRMIYVGDGQNDYCPALRMENKDEKDIYFVRRGRSLEAYLTNKNKIGVMEALKARIVYWNAASDVLQELQIAL
ncbi:hypothetical protein BGZ50_008684 [Haplosporangium sp. Z 11]|nr:hypothetical protein BGZ50_008684 [Haplosporangium sp. Z 11]